MESSQVFAIELHRLELINALQPAELCLSYLECSGIISVDERELVAKSSKLPKDQLLNLLGSLHHKDNGWAAIISYLKSDDKKVLADQLETTANEQSTCSAKKNASKQRRKLSPIEVFSLRLAEYYQANYAHVPTVGESSKHVKDVWVPLQIDEGEDVAAERIDHRELLNRLRSIQGRNFALIKGDPGMGKTTLAKKIAYDWAHSYGSADEKLFSLVLAVPLRSAGKSTRFDQLAIDYFLSVLDIDDMDKAEITRDIKQLNTQLLVILDGLDEYTSYDEGPFKVMFAPPFRHPVENCNVPVRMISFKLLITSRPYACERVSWDFFPLRFVILPLDANHLTEFVNYYCRTLDGVAKVTEYLNVNSELVIKVPLILTFVCYLADSEQKIPTNMTSLYDNLIRQMIMRENRQGKLSKSVNMRQWRDSDVVQASGELAFQANQGRLEFTNDLLDKCLVTNDSFICGFLLHKFDFAEGCLKAEFPHRSIQEFFAALYCFQVMLSGCKYEFRSIRLLIAIRDSQFGRCFFGICSQEGQFVRMTNWLKPSLGYSADILSSLTAEINQFGSSLRDCSAEENALMGQKLWLSIGLLEDKIISPVQVRLLSDNIVLHNFSDYFKKGLRRIDLTRDLYAPGVTTNWCVADNRQVAQLAVVSRLSELLEKKFDQINILIWNTSVSRTSEMEWKTIFSQIRSLPPVRTFMMSTMNILGLLPDVSVINHVDYGCSTRWELCNFGFWCDKERRKELLLALPDDNSVKLTEKKRHKSDLGSTPTVYISVTVDSGSCQSAITFSLIRLALLSTTSLTV